MLPIFRNTLMATTAKATGALFLAALICSSTAAAGAIKLDADTVQEFMNAAHQKFGGNLLGKTNVNPKDNWRFDKS
jgi:hypothetical protein